MHQNKSIKVSVSTEIKPFGLALSILFQVGHQLPDILVAFGQLPFEADHPGTLNAIGDGIEHLLVTATMSPGAIHQIWRLTGATGAAMTIATTGAGIK